MHDPYAYDTQYDQYYDEFYEEPSNDVYENLENHADPNAENVSEQTGKYYYAANEDYYCLKQTHNRSSRKKRSLHQKSHPYYLVPVLYMPKKLVTSTKQKQTITVNVPYGDGDQSVLDVDNETKYYRTITSKTQNQKVIQSRGCFVTDKETQYDLSDFGALEKDKPMHSKKLDTYELNQNYGILFRNSGDRISNSTFINFVFKGFKKLFTLCRNTLITYISYMLII